MKERLRSTTMLQQAGLLAGKGTLGFADCTHTDSGASGPPWECPRVPMTQAAAAPVHNVNGCRGAAASPAGKACLQDAMHDTQGPACDALRTAGSQTRSLGTDDQAIMRLALSSGDHLGDDRHSGVVLIIWRRKLVPRAETGLRRKGLLRATKDDFHTLLAY